MCPTVFQQNEKCSSSGSCSVGQKLSPAAAAAKCAELRERYAAAGQDHVFKFYDQLNTAQQNAFLAHLDETDPARVVRIHKTAMEAAKADTAVSNAFAPPPAASILRATSSEFCKLETEYRRAGLDAIANGKCALVLLAGGQGTRLGSSAPKGCYDIGLPSRKSLFQLQAERLLRVQQLAAESVGGAKKFTVPWYIMVSAPTRKATEDFFKENNYFGCEEKQIVFFEQGTLPAIDAEGRFVMEARDRLAVAPDGNGGIYAALARPQGVLADLAKRGIDFVHVYCVDNCLVRVLDPVFIGMCVVRDLDVAAKTVPKTAWDEPVGVVCMRENKFSVAEYTEIPESVARLKESLGANERLAFGSANIANHCYSRRFLERLCNEKCNLAYHVAHKKVPHIDMQTGEPAPAPTRPNAVKLELFIFDVFPLADPAKFGIFEGIRAQEFSPLKNKSGPDSAESSRRDIMVLHYDYLVAAGGVPSSPELRDAIMRGEDKNATCEISPLVSFAGENLEKRISGKQIALPLLINP